MTEQWEVIVSNVGTVFSAPNGEDAKLCFEEYKDMSDNNVGRAAGENVTLFRDGEVVSEKVGRLHQDEGACPITLFEALSKPSFRALTEDEEYMWPGSSEFSHIGHIEEHGLTVLLDVDTSIEAPNDQIYVNVYDGNGNWWCWKIDGPDFFSGANNG
jgi:hypothetical protein